MNLIEQQEPWRDKIPCIAWICMHSLNMLYPLFTICSLKASFSALFRFDENEDACSSHASLHPFYSFLPFFATLYQTEEPHERIPSFVDNLAVVWSNIRFNRTLERKWWRETITVHVVIVNSTKLPQDKDLTVSLSLSFLHRGEALVLV